MNPTANAPTALEICALDGKTLEEKKLVTYPTRAIGTITGSCFHLAWLMTRRQSTNGGTKSILAYWFIWSLQVVFEVAFTSATPYKTVPTVIPKPRNNE